MDSDPGIESDAYPILSEPILKSDSFLRHLPQVLAVEDRIRWEALVFISDALTYSYRAIFEGAAKCAADHSIFDDQIRTSLFISAWSIVDNVHAARQIIKSSGTEIGPRTQDFLDTTEGFTLLRNDMDHLSSKIGNLAAAKGFRAPIFGALSFFHAPAQSIRQEGGEARLLGGRSITISAGSLAETNLLPLVLPGGRNVHPPVDLIKLSAFKHELEFGPAIARFARACRHLGDSTG